MSQRVWGDWHRGVRVCITTLLRPVQQPQRILNRSASKRCCCPVSVCVEQTVPSPASPPGTLNLATLRPVYFTPNAESDLHLGALRLRAGGAV